MTTLAPIELDDGTVIYMEAEDDLVAPPLSPSSGTTRTPKGGTEAAVRKFQALQGTIRTYTINTLNTFQGMATGNIEKVTLEFGVKVAGEAGVPYITKGSTEGNLKITVECSFPKHVVE